MDTPLGTGTQAAFYEVKSGLSSQGVVDGAAQTARTAGALKSMGIPGVAVLMLDPRAWGGLSSQERGALFQQVSKAGGLIQLQPGLNEMARARAEEMIRRAQEQ